MLNRHAYLLLGLLIAGGAPYLTRSSETDGTSGDVPAPMANDLQQSAGQLPPADGASNVPPFSSVPNVSAETTAHVRVAGAESQASSAGEVANPFGGSTSTRPANAPATTANGTAGRIMLASDAAGGAVPASNQRGGQSPTATQSAGQGAAGNKAANDQREYPGPSPKNKRIEFGEIFRLDINNAWLMAHWPRVTTGLTELDWHGYRVSLTTGTQEDDVAGALTFYYDKEQVIQKMTFRGLTGDPRKLVWFATTTYEFEREATKDPAVQVYRNRKGRHPSELIVRPATVIRAEAPRERFEVELVLYR